ncbi:VPA1262 family N-terminal domain-containing protein [Priestia megaterium]|uniref:VPA1262 family N-terminal domain-containing protein n=1 Tax=Priestia megaterium TaxID=1404 RepID=UPI00300934FB
MLLNQVAPNYERAEITVIWLHDRATEQHINIFSVAELCPVEQPLSKAIQNVDTNGQIYPLRRESLDESRTLYVTRCFIDNPNDALVFFRGNGSSRTLPLSTGEINLLSIGDMVQEPPYEVPLIIPPNKYPKTSLEHVLPKRPVSQRVCSFFDLNGKVLEQLTEKDQAKLSTFSSQNIGINLALYQEFIGAVILCFPNPYLRNISTRMSNDQKLIILEMYERKGKSITEGEIQISDERMAGSGFVTKHKIVNPRLILPLPCPPEKLRIRLFGPEGELLSDEASHFVNQINIDMNVTSSVRRIKINEDNKKTLEVTTHTTQNIKVGQDGKYIHKKLAKAEEERVLDKLEQQRSFIYFPGNSTSSKAYAKQIIRDLIGTTKERCIICDPYLSGPDVVQFGLFIKQEKACVQLLSSSFFLSKKIDSTETLQGEILNETLFSIKKSFPLLDIQCRVLKGKEKSPLHDRFLIIDETVYLLGSSLNEFGSRATTLFKVPNPRPIIRQVDTWWLDTNATITIEQWITNRKKERDSE